MDFSVKDNLGRVAVGLDSADRLTVEHHPVGDTGAVLGFCLSDAGLTSKVAASVLGIVSTVGELSDGLYGFTGEAARGCIKPFSNAAGIAALRKSVIEGHNTVSAVVNGDTNKAGWSFIKAVNATSEFVQGFCSSIGGSPALIKSAGNLKHFTAIPSDIKGIVDAYDKQQNGVVELPQVPGHQGAKMDALGAQMAKNISGVLYHTISFAVGFFALVISPLWVMVLGVAYLLASIVHTVFDVRVDDIKQAYLAGRISQALGVNGG